MAETAKTERNQEAFRIVEEYSDRLLAAYYRWKRMGERPGFDRDDWFESEADLSIKGNYSVWSGCPMGIGKKVFIGDPEFRRCRYCGRSFPEATFRKEAHALPELIGNKILIALDECDRCNEFFSRELEDHLSKFTLPFRTLSAMIGKKGVPSYKSRDQKSRIDYHSSDRRFAVEEKSHNHILVPDEESNSMRLTLACQPYIPIAVHKCLTKMALAIMPSDELGHFGRAIEWIRDPDHGADIGPFKRLGCYLYHSPRPFPEAWKALLRREEAEAPMPYMLFLVGSANLLMQIFVPFCEMDRHLYRRSIAVPKYDLTVVPGFEGSSWRMIDLTSSVLLRTTEMSFNFTFESVISIDKSGNPL